MVLPITLTIHPDDPLKSSFGDILPQALLAFEGIAEKTCLGHEWTDWFDWPKNGGFSLCQEVNAWKQSYKPVFDTVVVCGIGGSYCGTRAVEQALTATNQAYFEGIGKPGPLKSVVYAGHNLSESGLIELLELLNHRLPILNIVSKSGTTTEPSIAFRLLREYFEKRFGKDSASSRIIATTDAKSGVLRQLCEKENYQSFTIPRGVGGRFSVLTAVGLVPLALAGVDIDQLMAGADSVFQSLTSEKLTTEHPCLQLASIRKAAWDAGKSIDVMAYSEPKMAAFVEWWKQLFGESEAKGGKGLFPSGMQYSTDLHSLGQLMQDGNPCVIETFLSVEREQKQSSGIVQRLAIPKAQGLDDKLDAIEGVFIADIDKAAMNAAIDAHRQRGVSCIEIGVKSLDSYHLGALFAFFESVCAVSALLLEVNPFTQDGVEAYKKNLYQTIGISR